MPIYAYRCNACGFEKDHLQKLSDPVLTTCPECGVASYTKQVTAAGFSSRERVGTPPISRGLDVHPGAKIAA